MASYTHLLAHLLVGWLKSYLTVNPFKSSLTSLCQNAGQQLKSTFWCKNLQIRNWWLFTTVT